MFRSRILGPRTEYSMLYIRTTLVQSNLVCVCVCVCVCVLKKNTLTPFPNIKNKKYFFVYDLAFDL